NRSRRTQRQAAVVLPVRQAVDPILIRILQQKIVIEEPAARPHYRPPIVSRVPRQTKLRSKIRVRLVHALAEELVQTRRDRVRNQTELIENQASRARRSLYDRFVD